MRWGTALFIGNPGATATFAHLRLLKSEAGRAVEVPCGACAMRVDGGAVVPFWMPGPPGVPHDTYGHARLVADAPVMAMSIDVPTSPAVDLRADRLCFAAPERPAAQSASIPLISQRHPLHNLSRIWLPVVEGRSS
jgi:hypothetical protein